MARYDHAVSMNLAIGPVKKKHLTDASHRAKPFKEIIESMILDDYSKKMATTVFQILKLSDNWMPYVNYYDGGVLLTYDNDSKDQHRILYVFIHPKHSVRYQVSKSVVLDNDHEWRYITDSDLIGRTIAYLGCYIQGTAEPTNA